MTNRSSNDEVKEYVLESLKLVIKAEVALNELQKHITEMWKYLDDSEMQQIAPSQERPSTDAQ